jgi:hypothetical protein|nr:MAG TPA: Terminase large subunit [Caudoviricetes sp.]
MDDIRLTKEQLAKIKAIKQDFYKFAKMNLYIKDKFANIVPFVPNEPQRALIDYVLLCIKEKRPVKVIILKARQMGFSTAVEALCYWWTSTNFNINSVIIGNDEKSSLNLYRMFRRYFDNTNILFKPSVRYNTKSDLTFERFDENGKQIGLGSAIKIETAKNKSAGRSDTINFLHGSEVATWESGEDLVASLMQTVPDAEVMKKPSMVFLESTAEGRGNYFHKEYVAAAEGKNNYQPAFAPWWILDTYERDATFEDLGKLNDYELFLVDLMKRGHDTLGHHFPISEDAIPRKLAFYRRKAKDFAATPERLPQEYPSCLVAGTMVGTDSGIVPIESMIKGQQTNLGEVLASWEQVKSPVAKITTSLGYTITGTYDHPVKTHEGFVDLIDTLNKDVVLLPPKTAEKNYVCSWKDLGVTHSIEVDERLAEWMGYFMGDGSYYGETISFAFDRQDKDVITHIKGLTEAIFGLGLAGRVVGTKKGGYELRASRKGMTRMMKELGLVRKRESSSYARILRVPEAIWRSPDTVIQAYLRGLLEADGWSNHTMVKFFSKNPEFVQDIQLLLLSQGITSRFKQYNTKNGAGYEYVANELSLRSGEADRFKRLIGFLSKRKNGRGFSKQTNPIVLRDTVVSVEPLGNDVTYNLTIKDGHEFDANGIHTHNTWQEAFIASGKNVFNPLALQEMEKDATPLEDVEYYKITPLEDRPYEEFELEQIPFEENETPDDFTYKAPLKIWEKPKPYKEYVIGADVAEGLKGGDFSVATVVDISTMAVVARWRGHCDPDKFGEILGALGTYYNYALIGVEVNNHGLTTVQKLRDTFYTNLYKRDRGYDEEWETPTVNLGWKTDMRTKRLMIDDLIKLVRERVIKDKDIVFINEAFSYVRDERGRMNAEEGSHDDVVMSTAIAYQLFPWGDNDISNLKVVSTAKMHKITNG